MWIQVILIVGFFISGTLYTRMCIKAKEEHGFYYGKGCAGCNEIQKENYKNIKDIDKAR